MSGSVCVVIALTHSPSFRELRKGSNGHRADCVQGPAQGNAELCIPIVRASRSSSIYRSLTAWNCSTNPDNMEKVRAEYIRLRHKVAPEEAGEVAH